MSENDKPKRGEFATGRKLHQGIAEQAQRVVGFAEALAKLGYAPDVHLDALRSNIKTLVVFDDGEKVCKLFDQCVMRHYRHNPKGPVGVLYDGYQRELAVLRRMANAYWESVPSSDVPCDCLTGGG